MVSIPSSQIKHILYYDIATRKQDVKPKRLQPNTKALIREAENNGYFTVITPEYLNNRFNQEHLDFSATKSIDKLKLIKAISLHSKNIQKIEYLEYCRNLVYLNLSKNFISNFSALKLCQNIICLDLSSNLIESLPEFGFWSNMTSLKIMYLHDNPIADPDSILGISGCPSISILTLWDTPLAVKRKYRHFVVNSIWSLKVLDQYFVSDEEIIEDANFRNSYFRSVSNKLLTSSYRTYGNEDAKEIETDLRLYLMEINQSISHLSPVLIIQRWIRGFLIRKKFKFTRPISKRNVILPQIPKSPVQSSAVETSMKTSEKDEIKYLKIDLMHLNNVSILENLDKEANLSSFMVLNPTMVTYRSISKLDHDKCSPEHITRALKYETCVEKDLFTYQNDMEEKLSFRFRGTKPTTSRNLNLEMMNEKNRSHYYIREADRSYHDRVLTDLPEIKSKPVTKLNCNKLFRQAQGCMSLMLLNKLSKTDYDIKKIESLQENINKIQTIKNERHIGQIKNTERKYKQLAVLKSHHAEHEQDVERSLENERKIMKKTAEELKKKNLEFSERKSKMKNEMDFSLDFRSKQTAACKAVDKFEQLTYKQEELQLNRNVVAETREKCKMEKDTVKAYLENQIIHRRTEKNLEHSALDLQILQQTNSMMNEAKMRVEKLKAIRRLVSCPHLPIAEMNVESLNKD